MTEKMRLAFKYKLRPTGKQGQAMRNFSGCCRFAYVKYYEEDLRILS